MDRFKTNRVRYLILAATFLALLVTECSLMGSYTVVYTLMLKQLKQRAVEKPCFSIPLRRPDLYYVSCPKYLKIVSGSHSSTWNFAERKANLDFMRNCSVAQGCREAISPSLHNSATFNSKNLCRFQIPGPNITLCFDTYKSLTGAILGEKIELLYEDYMMFYTHILCDNT